MLRAEGVTVRRGAITALQEIHLDLPAGQVFGVLGPNGAGKSTLLKILSRVTAPTSGVVKVKGRIGSLLEVGTGFHPELTGRENVFLNGAILGMRKEEVTRKFDEIVDFSGVEKFIDTPVKRYSSGMYIRLGFAVAAHLDPDILIVDEVLAVGDADFQKKCLGKMGDVAEEGRTVLFVSHNMVTMQRLCQNTIWLNDGQINDFGKTEDIISKYLASGLTKGTGVLQFTDGNNHLIRFSKLELINDRGDFTTVFKSDEDITMRIHYTVAQRVSGANLSVMIMNSSGDHLWEISDIDYKPELFDQRDAGNYVLDCSAPANVLKPGSYRIQLGSGSAVRKYHRPEVQMLFDIEPNGFRKNSYKFFGLSKSPIVLPWKIHGITEDMK